MKPFIALFVSLVSLAFVSKDRHASIYAVSSPACFACKGCAATRVTDPNAIPPITSGVQEIFKAPGVTVTIAALGIRPGQCSIVDGPEGPFCGPLTNCEFTAIYSVTSTTGQFHDDRAPCNWSTLAGGKQVMAGSFTWISACDDNQTWQTVAFYNNASSCTDGLKILELKFVGKCSRCTP